MRLCRRDRRFAKKISQGAGSPLFACSAAVFRNWLDRRDGYVSRAVNGGIKMPLSDSKRKITLATSGVGGGLLTSLFFVGPYVALMNMGSLVDFKCHFFDQYPVYSFSRERHEGSQMCR